MSGAVLCEGAAGAARLFASRPAKAAARWHGLSGRRLMVNFPHQLAAGIDLCSSYRLEHFYVPDLKKATKTLSLSCVGELVRRGSVRSLLRWRDGGQAENPSLTAFLVQSHIIILRWSGRGFCVVNGESFCAFKHKGLNILHLMKTNYFK